MSGSDHPYYPVESITSSYARSRSLWRLVVLLLVMWGLLVIRLGAPWFGLQEAPRLWIAAGVRNTHLHGLDTTGGMVVRNFEPVEPVDFNYYTHHPPTVIWLPYAVTLFAGQNELALRYGFIAVTLIGAAAFYVFVRRLHGERMALWATAFYALTPMMAYYGRVAGHDPLGLAVVMLFAAVLVNWVRQPRRHHLLALVILVWLAVWTAWTAVIMVGTLGLAAMWLGDRRHRLIVPLLGVVCVVGFVVMMAYYQSQWAGALDSLRDAFGLRASNLSDDRASDPFTAGMFLWQTLVHVMVFTTPGVTLLAALGVWPLLRRESRSGVVFWWGMFAGSVVYQLIFRNASYVHDYYKITLVPAMAIAAAAGWVHLRHDPTVRRWARPVIDAMLLLALVSGGALLVLLHLTGDRPHFPPLIDAVKTHTTSDDILVTRLWGRDAVWPVAYYVQREIVQDVSFDEVLAMARREDTRVIYIDCWEESPLDSPPPGAIMIGGCWLYIVPGDPPS